MNAVPSGFSPELFVLAVRLSLATTNRPTFILRIFPESGINPSHSSVYVPGIP